MEQSRQDAADRNKACGKEAVKNKTYGGKTNENQTDKHEAESSLAVRALEACRNQLFFRQRFLEQALFRLKWEEREDIFLGNDGEYLYYDRKYILKRYAESPGQMSLDYLHTVMHCLYQHPFFCPWDCAKEQEMCWNLAADLAVECVLEEMWERESGIMESALGQRGKVLQKVKDEIGLMSAQKIFSYLQKNVMQEGRETVFGTEFQSLCRLFQRDDHRLWYGGKNAGENNGRAGKNVLQKGENGTEIPRMYSEASGQKGLSENTNEEGQKIGERKSGETGDNKEEDSVRDRTKTADHSGKNLQQMWKNTAGRVLAEAQVFAHSGRGEIAGSLLQNLKKLTRETYDYTEFLAKFAAHREERMQIDEDEFDYAFYTYGLKLFGKIPLIEPLEYKEKNLIREFLIAIDTSGSCQGETVERFLTKTYNILRQAQSFTGKVNIHIVQCDARIREDTKIESRKELEAYIARLTLKGFGGTDFTPVFEYTDRLLESGEIRRLDGLLYFTDGYGTFPPKPPKYRTAFVFLDKAEEVKVPSWAMKVYLDT